MRDSFPSSPSQVLFSHNFMFSVKDYINRQTADTRAANSLFMIVSFNPVLSVDFAILDDQQEITLSENL